MEKNASLFTKNQQKLSLILIHQTTSIINSVENTLLSCYTLPPTQHHSFFRNLPSLFIFSKETGLWDFMHSLEQRIWAVSNQENQI